MSPLTQLTILKLIYKYWLRQLIINKIRADYSYQNLLEFTDFIISHNDADRKVGE